MTLLTNRLEPTPGSEAEEIAESSTKFPPLWSNTVCALVNLRDSGGQFFDLDLVQGTCEEAAAVSKGVTLLPISNFLRNHPAESGTPETKTTDSSEAEEKKGEVMGRRALPVVLLLAVVVLLQNAAPAWSGPNGRECRLERRVLVNACKLVIYGKPPNPQCCERVRRSHFECVCPAITPKLAALIDVNRLVKLVQGCGRQVPRHYKCGSE
ncbi:hypothetical protein Taro_011478 [Colocasia esculenta]|uniref:Bifunctional inhibitor/plant lipid transfer protein/seed storage helical domain-containing protein n=1 Tax=Colocasia esculenta TaxID=4460 RepID=A0A843UAS8_COLES|nr:hypothetical protein [Colocasia esculenta]